jgi:hypothetical protein
MVDTGGAVSKTFVYFLIVVNPVLNRTPERSQYRLPHYVPTIRVFVVSLHVCPGPVVDRPAFVLEMRRST